MGKKKKKNYAHSAAKYYLEKDLISGAIPVDSKDMSAEDAFKTRPEFAMHDGACLFKSRLTAARGRARLDKNVSAKESAALEEDRKLFPQKTTDHGGRPLWERSAAQKSLIGDIKNGMHLTMKPHDLWLTRPEYQMFELSVFHGHIQQEELYQKWTTHLHNNEVKNYNLPPKDNDE